MTEQYSPIHLTHEWKNNSLPCMNCTSNNANDNDYLLLEVFFSFNEPLIQLRMKNIIFFLFFNENYPLKLKDSKNNDSGKCWTITKIGMLMISYVFSFFSLVLFLKMRLWKINLNWPIYLPLRKKIGDCGAIYFRENRIEFSAKMLSFDRYWIKFSTKVTKIVELLFSWIKSMKNQHFVVFKS